MENIFDGKRSPFQSPIYNVKRIKVWELCGQAYNPNTLNSKSFQALQRSIFNNGYAMSISGAENPLYDEEFSKTLTIKQKIDLCIEGGSQDEKSGAVGDSSGLTFATQVSDENIRRAYPYQIIDGSQRTGIIRKGSQLFLEDKEIDAKVEKWSRGEDIPTEPGKEMLKYLAWREDFSMPVAIIAGKTDAEMMSATILFNPIHAEQPVYILREVDEITGEEIQKEETSCLL